MNGQSIVEKGRLLGHGCRNVVTKYHFQFDPLVPFVSPDHVSCFQFTTKIPLLCIHSANQTRSNQKDQQTDEKKKKKARKTSQQKNENGKWDTKNPWKNPHFSYLPLPYRIKYHTTKIQRQSPFFISKKFSNPKPETFERCFHFHPASAIPILRHNNNPITTKRLIR